MIGKIIGIVVLASFSLFVSFIAGTTAIKLMQLTWRLEAMEQACRIKYNVPRCYVSYQP